MAKREETMPQRNRNGRTQGRYSNIVKAAKARVEAMKHKSRHRLIIIACLLSATGAEAKSPPNTRFGAELGPVWNASCPTWSGAIPQVAGHIQLCSPWTANLYDPKARVPRAVAEYLSRKQLEGGKPRDDRFEEDQRLPKEAQSWLSDYRGSGYDRGHLAPAADFKQDAVAMSMSFLLSNIAPQDSDMNQKPWAGLENATRACARSLEKTPYGGLIVVTGTVLGSGIKTKAGRVEVPKAFYKVWASDGLVRAWIIPNIGPNVPKKKLSGQQFRAYEVSLAQVRQTSGINLLPNIKQSRPGKLCPGSLPQR